MAGAGGYGRPVRGPGEMAEAVDRRAAETGFSGVVRVDRGGAVLFAKAYGLADRACRLANSLDTRLAIASGTKGLTALTVMSLVVDATLRLGTTARSLLGDDLPLVGDDVTVEHLLAHRSGIGDYLDEDAGGYDVNDYVLPVPVHRLAATEDYLEVLDGHPPKFRAGERFSYCNGGYVVLALLAERAAGVPFHLLVEDRVCEPAGLRHTGFLRSDEPRPGVAAGYLDADGPRTNVLHLPVRGSGDGGAHTTAADVHLLWAALFAGRIVPAAAVAEMVRPHSDVPANGMRYGLGFWLHGETDAVMLEGCDAGVSFRTVHHPGTDVTHSVLANTSDGAWPLTRLLGDLLGT